MQLAASYDEMFNVIRRLTQFLLVWALPWQLDDDLIKQLNRAVRSFVDRHYTAQWVSVE